MNEINSGHWADPGYRRRATGVVMLGGFISVFSASIINVTLPEIQTAFGADVETIKWVVNIYLVAVCVLMPTTGWLSNRLGPKNVFILSLTVFTIGSFLSASAWNIDSLIIYRALQGVGGGLLWPMSMAIITIVFPPEQRGRGMAFYGIGTSMGGTAGPMLGGYMVDMFSWRMTFYLNVALRM